jgi:hypothetical protein
MAKAVYEVVQRGEQWFILHDGDEAGPYVTKENAFETLRFAASRSITDGLGVEIYVPEGQKDMTPHDPDTISKL